MGEISQPSKFERHIGRAPIYIGIAVFLMQMLTQFSLFFQLPEKVKILLARIDTMEEFAREAVATGTALHVAKEEQLKAMRHDINQREQAHQFMLEDDKTQWEAIRELDRRVDALSTKEPQP